MEMGAFSISLAHTVVIPFRLAARGNTPIPSKRLPSLISATSVSLSLDGKNTVKRSSCDTKTLGNGDVVLHSIGDGMTTYHQNMRTTKQVTAHINAAFVLLGNCVHKEQGQIERGTDGRIARLIHGAAVIYARGRFIGKTSVS